MNEQYKETVDLLLSKNDPLVVEAATIIAELSGEVEDLEKTNEGLVQNVNDYRAFVASKGIEIEMARRRIVDDLNKVVKHIEAFEELLQNAEITHEEAARYCVNLREIIKPHIHHQINMIFDAPSLKREQAEEETDNAQSQDSSART